MLFNGCVCSVLTIWPRLLWLSGWRWYSKWISVSFIACSRYIQSSDWMSLAYHAVCSTEHWVVNFPFRFHWTRSFIQTTKQQITQNIFMFITKKCLRYSSVANVNNNSNSNIEWFGWCACVILLLWFCILVKFSLDWLAHGICKGAFIHNPFSIKLNRKWLFGEPKANSTPFAAYLDIWSLWCVCLIFHYVCSRMMHTINMCTQHTYNMDMMRWKDGCAVAIGLKWSVHSTNNSIIIIQWQTMILQWRDFQAFVGIRSQNLFVSWPSAYLCDKCKIAVD